MRRRAPRHADEDRAYRELRARLIPGPCEVCPQLIAAGVEISCDGLAHELHHRRKRSSSGALANRANVVVCCHTANMAMEDRAEVIPVAEQLGLVVREGHPEWDELSARAWRLAA